MPVTGCRFFFGAVVFSFNGCCVCSGVGIYVPEALVSLKLQPVTCVNWLLHRDPYKKRRTLRFETALCLKAPDGRLSPTGHAGGMFLRNPPHTVGKRYWIFKPGAGKAATVDVLLASLVRRVVRVRRRGVVPRFRSTHHSSVRCSLSLTAHKKSSPKAAFYF